MDIPEEGESLELNEARELIGKLRSEVEAGGAQAKELREALRLSWKAVRIQKYIIVGLVGITAVAILLFVSILQYSGDSLKSGISSLF